MNSVVSSLPACARVVKEDAQMDGASATPLATEDWRAWGSRSVAALALLFAGFASAYTLYTVPAPRAEVWPVLQVCGEWLMGLWLLSGLDRQRAWTVAIALFGTFAIYNC